MSWTMLHRELWGLIFDLLPVPSLATSALVCSAWKAMVMDEALWQSRLLSDFGIEDKGDSKSWREAYRLATSLQWMANEVVAVSENGRLATSSTVIRGTTYNGVISKQSFSLEDRSRSHYFECEIATHQSGHLGIGVALESTLKNPYFLQEHNSFGYYSYGTVWSQRPGQAFGETRNIPTSKAKDTVGIWIQPAIQKIQFFLKGVPLETSSVIEVDWSVTSPMHVVCLLMANDAVRLVYHGAKPKGYSV